MLILKNRILNYKLIDGACNAQILRGFFEETKNSNFVRPNNIFLMDNVSFHKKEDKLFLRNNNIYLIICPRILRNWIRLKKFSAALNHVFMIYLEHRPEMK